MNATWEFIKRHKGKIVLGGAFVGSTVAYVLHSRERPRDSFVHPINDNDELKVKARKHYVFDTNHRSCDQSIIDLIPSIKLLHLARFDVDSLIRKIQHDSLNSADKLEKWEQIKRTTIARLVSQAYAYSILTVALKSQISILAAEICAHFEKSQSSNSWLSDLIYGEKKTSQNDITVDNSSRQIFLQCIQFFTTKGIYQLFELVEVAVDQELDNITLKDKFDKKIMRNLLQRIENRLDEGFPKNILEMVAPLSDNENIAADGVYKLLNRLKTVLESSWCRDTLSSLVDFYFSAACYKLPDSPTPLATILPKFAESFEFVSSNIFDSPLQNSLNCSDVHSYAMRVFKMME